MFNENVMKIELNQPYSFYQMGQRHNQEDARYPDTDTPPVSQRCFIVCDGVGGQDKGEVASSTVCRAMGQYMNSVNPSKPFDSIGFKKALDYGYQELFRAMTEQSRDMATTLTFIDFSPAGALVAHMGDSRVYQIRPGVGIMYMTSDHSLVNALVHTGNITPQEAINHPRSNYITRCMSYVDSEHSRPSADVIQITDIEAGDYFFMCTDGVLHCISDELLVEILSETVPDKEKIDRIAALSRDSNDNNTAYLINVKSVEKNNDEQRRDTLPDSSAGADTVRIEPGCNNIIEVQSSAPVSLKSKVSSFFKKIF